MNTPLAPSKILGSWKEIAAYLGKGVRTVQRWEQLYGLPVRRPHGSPMGVVYASCDELDVWLVQTWEHRHTVLRDYERGNGYVTLGDTPKLVQQSQQLRCSNIVLIESIREKLHELYQGCEQLKVALRSREEFAPVFGPGGSDHGRVE